MFGLFKKKTEEEKRAEFIRDFVAIHYSNYREDAAMPRVIADAKMAWEAIRSQ